MFDFFNLLAEFFKNIFGVLNTAIFNLGGVTVSLGSLLLGFVALSMVISFFWKGAKG